MSWLKNTPDGMIAKLCDIESYLAIECGRLELSFGNFVVQLSRAKSEEVANEILVQQGKAARGV